MPISYAERKKRRQALLQGLVPELRPYLALRHVEGVAKLSVDGQRTLAAALSAGLRRIPDAIAYIQEQPQASVEELLCACQNGRQEKAEIPVPSTILPRSDVDPEPGVLAELADLLQVCFPGMPSMTARALAADELLSDLLALVHIQQACFRSKSIQSELVFVVLCGLALQFVDELNRLMDSRPHYRGALMQSGLNHKWSDRLIFE